MKKNFLFALVGMVAMLMSCSKEVEKDGSLLASKTTSFKVSVEGGVNTRADNEVALPTRYVMEVYKGATAADAPVVHSEQATGAFDVVLDYGQEYTVLFWADYGTPTAKDAQPNAANEYNAADLKAARVVAGKQPTKAAYLGVSRFTVGTTPEEEYSAVKLKHAVAQVNFVQTEDLTTEQNTLEVSYPESYSLNVDGNAVTKIEGAVTHTFAYNQKTKGTLGTSYIIAATGAVKTVLEVTAKLNAETEIAVSNVPFERNFRTNISGAYSSKYAANLTIYCGEDWSTTDNEAQIPGGELVGTKVGDLYPNTTNPVGVIFWINPEDKTKGKIVSLDEKADEMWSVGMKVTDATSHTDGAANTAKVLAMGDFSAAAYPAFAWVKSQNDANTVAGIKWYLPAKEELQALYGNYNGNSPVDSSVKDAVNTSLRSVSGAAQLSKDYYYWSSTEDDDECAWFVLFGNGSTKLSGKDNNFVCSVRTIATFGEPIVSVTSITVAPTTATIEVGKTKTLTATVLPSDATDKSVVWSSSNKTIATVSDAGDVAAVAVGTAIITATSKLNPTVTATCKVTVTKEPSITWAVGNLVADGANKARIGTATDVGLYFQFGSLVGWSTAGNSTVSVKPVGCTVTSWNSFWTGDPATDDAVSGKGDPCRYYLKGTWRLPTKDEYAALFNNVTDGSYANSGGWSWDATAKSATNNTKNLTFSASGYRTNYNSNLDSVGTLGYYWSASPVVSAGYYLIFNSSFVMPSGNDSQALGFPVRCVQASN